MDQHQRPAAGLAHTAVHQHQTECCTASCTAAGTAEGYELYTMDHDSGALRLDLAHRWDDPSAPQPVVPEDELICDPSAGWLCSQANCSLE